VREQLGSARGKEDYIGKGGWPAPFPGSGVTPCLVVCRQRKRHYSLSQAQRARGKAKMFICTGGRSGRVRVEKRGKARSKRRPPGPGKKRKILITFQGLIDQTTLWRAPWR